MQSDIVSFVHISDTHIGPTPDYERHSHRPFPCAQKMVEVINTLPVRPDFVIHTGDVVTEPSPKAYKLAAEIFAGLTVPIYYVTGNHDRATDIHQYLTMGSKDDFCSDKDVLAYTFEVKGCRFLVLDARGPDEIDPHGLLPPRQIEWVQQEATAEGKPLTVFLHFPLLRMNSPWMDAYMLVVNADALHQSLLPARERLRGVFHGHIHQSMQVVQDGITYTAVPSTFSQFTAWPTDVQTGFAPDALPGYNFVQLLPHRTVIQQHTFPRPD